MESESDKKIRLRLPVLLGVRLRPKASRLRNPACDKVQVEQVITVSAAIDVRI